MKLKEILKNIDITEFAADGETQITGVSYDSRSTRPGDLFVAVKGFDTDGHKYIPAAVEKGAAAVLCEEKPDCGVPYAVTPNSRLGLALASRDFFGDPESQMTMIAVTGTNGKTTTTYMMKHLLETLPGVKVGLVGTNGNMIGDEFIHTERTTPESYELQKLFREMLDAGCTHVVMEVSSHSLVLDRVAGIRFRVGIFTNLTQDHLDFHKTMEQYAKAKAMLFERCDAACINLDDQWAEYMIKSCACPVTTFSAKTNDATLTANDVRLSASGVKFCALYGGNLQRVSLGIPGMFSVHNALGVIAAGLCLGISLSDCCRAISSAKGVKGRVEVVPTDGDYTIIIDYAHTPDALENVLKTMKQVTNGRLVALFGCGGDRDRTKRPIMGAIAAQLADMCIVTSDNPRTEEPQAIIDEIVAGMKGSRTPTKVIPDRREAICWAIDNHCPGDVIVLAGKGHEDYQVIGHEKHHMDEREIVAQHLEKRKNDK
jgi:UDP-N-acetylmuramoyl-L-alanyl-D-glutamate--2,6-diaminopimelate ligase